jgi:hypothetical protein
LLAEGAIIKGIFFTRLNLNLIIIWSVKWKYIKYCLKEYVFKFLILIGQFLFH